MAKLKTEEAPEMAMAERGVLLTGADVETITWAAECSKATFCRSAAYAAFTTRLGPRFAATTRTTHGKA